MVKKGKADEAHVHADWNVYGFATQTRAIKMNFCKRFIFFYRSWSCHWKPLFLKTSSSMKTWVDMSGHISLKGVSPHDHFKTWFSCCNVTVCRWWRDEDPDAGQQTGSWWKLTWSLKNCNQKSIRAGKPQNKLRQTKTKVLTNLMVKIDKQWTELQRKTMKM